MSSHLLVMWSGIYLSLVKWSRLSFHGHVIQVIPSWSCDPGYSSLFTWSGLFLLRQSRDPDYSSLFMWSVLFLLGHVIRIIHPWSRDPDYSSLVTWSGMFILSHVIQIIPPWSYDPDYSSLVTWSGLFWSCDPDYSTLDFDDRLYCTAYPATTIPWQIGQ